jgi:hypothetical protein
MTHRAQTLKRVGLSATAIVIAMLAAIVSESRAAGTAVPGNTAEPRISGTPVVGRTLTATRGTWSGSPTSYDYQWVRCPGSGGLPSGADCAAIAGAATSAYVVGSGDVGKRLRVRVTATNADGSATAASNATAAVVRPGGVANLQLPKITGTPAVGATVTASPGTWAGENLTYAYSWRRCDTDGAGCSPIQDANKKAYTIQPVDAGNTLRVRVVARNDDRSATATSAPTDLVRRTGQPAAEGCPAGSGGIQVSSIAPPARLLIDRQVIEPGTVTRSTTSVTVRFRIVACGGRPVEGALVYVTAVPYNQFTTSEKPTNQDGWSEMTLRRMGGYPASPAQQLLVMFVRARKAGEPTLGGVSSRRLVSFPVRLG